MAAIMARAGADRVRNGAMRDAWTVLVAVAVVLGSACTEGEKAAPPPPEPSAKSEKAAPPPQEPKPEPKQPAASPHVPLIYVSDEVGGNIVAVDPADGKVVATIAVGKRPRGIKLSRDGKLLYTAVTGSPQGGPNVDESKLPPADRNADGIGVVDLAAHALVRVLKSGQDPETFDVSADGKTLYVSNEETAEMSVLDLASGEIRGKVTVGREPEGVTVSPDGKTVYVTSEEDSEVTAVDTATLRVTAHMPTGKRPRSLVFAHDGVTAFVMCESGGVVTVLDTAAHKTIDTLKITQNAPAPAVTKGPSPSAAPSAGPPKPSVPRPMGAALSKDGKTLYVSCGRGGSVAVIDVATRKQVRSIDGVGERPWGIALSLDEKRLYTANGTGFDMSIVDIASGNVEKRVHIGASPWGVLVAP
jgi:YVTN family beta-propeller protein